MVCAALAGLAAVAAARPPNVILVLTDDQGYGDLACHGNTLIKTPNLDKLHDQSTRLVNFHVAPLCTPTRAALMTGQSPLRNGAWGTTWGRSLPRPELKTVADLFAANGYSTAMFGKWHLGDNYPYRPSDRGFRHVVRHKGGGVGQGPDAWGNNYFDDTYFVNGKPTRFKGYCADIWFDEAMRFIGQNQKRPFFAYLATNTPHAPLNVAKKYEDLYSGNPAVPNARFYGMITNIDENMGRLMQRLKELGLEKNTILVFMSDNGTAHGLDNGLGFNAGMKGAKGSLFDGGHRVPFFIRWPDGSIEPGRDIRELCTVEDLLPTLAGLCGMDAGQLGQKLDGIDLAPLLRNKTQTLPSRIVSTEFRQSHTPPVKWHSAVLCGDWRLLWGSELFNVATDPGQTNNVAARHPEIVERLRGWYENRWNEVAPDFGRFSPIVIGSGKAPKVRLDSLDWACDKSVWDQWQIRQGYHANGPWHIEVARPGLYRFALRRWSREINVPIVGQSGPGYNKAIALTDATIEIQGIKRTRPIGPDDLESVFEIPLEKGTTQLKTTFSNRQTGDSLGAYYVYVERVR
jgi:arylsulfatase A-like enzyme